MSDDSNDPVGASGEAEPPSLDAEACARVLGKHLLLGLTYQTYNGKVIERRQIHGIVEEISSKGITIRMADRSTFTLPPDLRGIRHAPPGVYRLHSTGEEVEDPDFIASWTVTRPDV